MSLLGVEGGANSCKKWLPTQENHRKYQFRRTSAGEILSLIGSGGYGSLLGGSGREFESGLRALLGAQSLAGRHLCSRLGKLLLAPPTRHAESEAMVCLTRRQRAGAGGGRVQCVDPSLQPSRCVTSQRVPEVTRGRRQAPSCLTLNVTPDSA